ncbi:MAG: hypothetical protein FJY83_05890 [Candidatus Aminicenantes bacterium]|nr:hypothetical protein [Candidatus Aminicenantes bacterium]
MNMKQRLALIFGIVLLALSILYPPYLGKQTQEFMNAPAQRFTKFLGYHLIFIGPPESDSYLYPDRIVISSDKKHGWSNDEPYTRHILLPLWLGQFAVIVLLTVVLVKVFRNKAPKTP